MTQYGMGGKGLLPPTTSSTSHLIPMLSSISSFLPSALQIGNDKSPPHQDSDKHLTQSPTSKDDDDMAIDEHGAKKKKERSNEVSLSHFLLVFLRLGYVTLCASSSAT